MNNSASTDSTGPLNDKGEELKFDCICEDGDLGCSQAVVARWLGIPESEVERIAAVLGLQEHWSTERIH